MSILTGQAVPSGFLDYAYRTLFTTQSSPHSFFSPKLQRPRINNLELSFRLLCWNLQRFFGHNCLVMTSLSFLNRRKITLDFFLLRCPCWKYTCSMLKWEETVSISTSDWYYLIARNIKISTAVLTKELEELKKLLK